MLFVVGSNKCLFVKATPRAGHSGQSTCLPQWNALRAMANTTMQKCTRKNEQGKLRVPILGTIVHDDTTMYSN